MTTLAETMALTFRHPDGEFVKFTPAVAERVWMDSYQDGALVSTDAVHKDKVADLIIELNKKGYRLDS